MMLVQTNKNKIRAKGRLIGTSIAELPVALWVIFIGIGMPLLSLALITVRFGLFVEAAREAADVASQAQNYTGTGQTGQTSAVTLAQDTAVRVASSFSGITLSPDNVNCWIVITPLSAISSNSSSSTVVGPNTSLTSPPDPTKNLYQLRVDISGQIQPMLAMPIEGFLNIPGLSSPMPAKVSMTRVIENPPGLYQGISGAASGSL
jgi:hypothetical protein